MKISLSQTMSFFPGRASSQRRGMTLIEMLIAMSVFAVIGVFVVYLTLAAARVSKTGAEAYRAENRIRSALETASKHLMPAEFDSVVFLNNNHRIEFSQWVDDPDESHWPPAPAPPPKIQVTSALSFESVTNASHGLSGVDALVYKPNRDDTNYDSYKVIRRLEEPTVLGRTNSLKGIIILGLKDVTFEREESGSIVEHARERMVRITATAAATRTTTIGTSIDMPIVVTQIVRLRNEL